jgi:hypothetical protein
MLKADASDIQNKAAKGINVEEISLQAVPWDQEPNYVPGYPIVLGQGHARTGEVIWCERWTPCLRPVPFFGES